MNTHMKTRMQREIGSLYQEYNNINVVFQPEKNIHIITITDKNDTIVFLVNDNVYPFGPPKCVYINNINYCDYIKTPYHILPYIQKVGNITCFCCETILKNQLWQPAHTLMHIVKELKYVKYVMHRATLLYLVDRIKEKNGLPEYFDLIEEYLL